MHSSGLQQCIKPASPGGTLPSQQDVQLTTSPEEASRHGIARHGVQPSRMQGTMSADSPALQPGGSPPPQQASSLCDDSLTGCTIIPMKSPGSASAASPCKVGSELSGRRAKKKSVDTCSIDIEEQARGAAHAAHSKAHLEWAQRTGYLAGEELVIIAFNRISRLT